MSISGSMNGGMRARVIAPARMGDVLRLCSLGGESRLGKVTHGVWKDRSRVTTAPPLVTEEAVLLLLLLLIVLALRECFLGVDG